MVDFDKYKESKEKEKKKRTNELFQEMDLADKEIA